jgi:hypothetical protein
LPVVASFMGLRSLRRDNAPFFMVSIGVNHRDFKTVHKANGIDPNFALVETLIDPFNSGPLKKSASHPRKQCRAVRCCCGFFFVPTRVPSVYLHNVNISSFWDKFGTMRQ